MNSKKRSILGYFSIATLSVSLIGLLLSTVPGMQPGELRVMSYNIKAGQQSGIRQIAEVIEAHDPDIVALQEVDVHWGERSGYRHQARYLGRALNMHYFFGEIYTLSPPAGRTKSRRYGLAILSKYPFRLQENHRITRLSSLKETSVPRKLPGFPEVSVQFAGKDIHLFNTHLDYRPDPQIRKTQVDEMLAIMKRREAPALLLGDLNAEPSDPEISKLFEMFNDVWENRNESGNTYPADNPGKRIDYILYSDHFVKVDAFVAGTKKSDHRPVVADFNLK